MIREIDFENGTDGKRYNSRDMARLGCGGCRGCSECCSNQGTMIILDPYDIYMLTTRLHRGFDTLLSENLIRLKPIDGTVLPGLQVKQEGAEREECVFLNSDGRCIIHDARPSICRLFPLGRLYEGDSFTYILQTGECPKADGSKYKISSWIGIQDMKKYEKWVLEYHGILKQVQEIMSGSTPEMKQKINLGFLNLFFRDNYDEGISFYEQFEKRKHEMI